MADRAEVILQRQDAGQGQKTAKQRQQMRIQLVDQEKEIDTGQPVEKIKRGTDSG